MKKWIDHNFKNQVSQFSIKSASGMLGGFATAKLLSPPAWFQNILFAIIIIYIVLGLLKRVIELLKCYDERNALREKNTILNDHERIKNNLLRQAMHHD